MVCKITSINARHSGFTLVEIVIVSGISLVVLLAIGSLSLYSSRSFVAIANYLDLDQQSQLALDKMSREIRQVDHVNAFYPPTNITFVDFDGQTLQYVFDPKAATLVRTKAGQPTTTNLIQCDSLLFSIYQHTPKSNAFDCFDAAYVTNAKLVQVTWVCSRKILGAKVNTESVQSAKIVIRKRS